MERIKTVKGLEKLLQICLNALNNLHLNRKNIQKETTCPSWIILQEKLTCTEVAMEGLI